MDYKNNQPILYSTEISNLKYRKDIKREDFSNSFEYLLARDGFIHGCDYDWNGDWSGSDFSLGDNHIVFGGNARAKYCYYKTFCDLYNIRAIGFNAVNYWILGSLQGITFDHDGYVTGIDKSFLNNLRELCEICRKIGIFLLPSLQPHGNANSWGMPNSKGEPPIYVWNKYFKFIWNKKAREMYLNNAIKPVCEIFAEYQDIILCVGVTIENSTGWVSDMDIGYMQGDQGVKWNVWKDFVNDLHDCVKAASPNLLTSTEEAGGIEKLTRLNETKVDILGANYYHAGAYVPPREIYVTGRPGYIGEYNVGDGPRDSYLGFRWGDKRHEFIKSAREAGWIGCFLYKYCVDGGDYTTFKPRSNTLYYEDMYEWCHGFRKPITEAIYNYRGERPEIETAVLLANKGTENVYWIPSPSGSVYSLERSFDGESFTLVADNINAADYTLENGLIRFTDNAVCEGMTYCYRVTVHTSDGKTAVSAPNNLMTFRPEKNLVINGNFASGDLSGWTPGEKSGEIIKHPENNRFAVKVDYSKKDTACTYGGFEQTITIKPSTPYVINVKYRVKNMVSGGEPPFVRIYSTLDRNNISVLYLRETNGFAMIRDEFVTSFEEKEVKVCFSMGSMRDKGEVIIEEIALTELR